MHMREVRPDAPRGPFLYSAPLEAFLATSPWNRVWGPATGELRAVGVNNLFPGLMVPGLILAGAIALRRSGETLADADLMIAAIALARGAELATGNVRHFRRFPDLPVEDWIREPPPESATRGDTPS